MRAAGGGGRHGHDFIAPVGAARGHALGHLVFAQVLQADGTGVRGHLGRDLLGDLAFVERLGALLGDQAHGLRQVFLHQRVAHLQGLAVLPEDGLGGRPLAHVLLLLLQDLGERFADRETLVGQFDGGGDHARQGQGAPGLERVLHARHGAGHAHGVVGVQRFAIHHVALGIQVHVARGLRWRHFAEVERHALAGLGIMHHHEAATTQVARIGQGHGQRKANAHGRVHRVATGLEDVQADLRGQFLLGGDHAVACHHGVEHVHAEVVGRAGGLGGCCLLHGGCGRGCRGGGAAAGREAGQGQRQAGGQQRVSDVHGSCSLVFCLEGKERECRPVRGPQQV